VAPCQSHLLLDCLQQFGTAALARSLPSAGRNNRSALAGGSLGFAVPRTLWKLARRAAERASRRGLLHPVEREGLRLKASHH